MSRTVRLIPKAGPPTRHPRRGGLGTVHVGERLTVRLSAVGPNGVAVARLGPVVLSVPFGVPGEEAVVEVTKGGRRAQGRLVALLRKSASTVAARCPHFGRCGGCQWQHLVPEAQRRLKTALVKDFLKEHAGVQRDIVREAVGGEVWAYRTTLSAAFAKRGGVTVAGYRAAASEHVIDISGCPVQHPTNEAILHTVRSAVRALGLPIHDRTSGTGLMRGVLGLVSFATGEALLTLSIARPLRDTAPLVHALVGRVPGLVGILSTVQPGPAPELLGRRLRLLWGRESIVEEVAGLRFVLRPATEVPPNPNAMPLVLDAVRQAAALGTSETALDLTASTPLLALALSRDSALVIGVTPDRQAMADGWQAAEWNGIANAVFYARSPFRVLSRLTGRDRPHVVVVTARGPGLDEALVQAVAAAGIPRVAYLARSLATCAGDLIRWRQAGYQAVAIQPVDVLPQTRHVHLVVTLLRGRIPPA